MAGTGSPFGALGQAGLRRTRSDKSFLLKAFVIGNIFITLVFMKYNELFRMLKKDGWFEVRQKGSHVIMQHYIKPEQLIVPYHAGKEVKKRIIDLNTETSKH